MSALRFRFVAPVRLAWAMLLAAPAVADPPRAAADPAGLPQSLRDTGLYESGAALRIRAGNASFTPQYALWSDGTGKRRWLWLPPGSAIDASRPDAWDFPVGTRLWKEFGYAGRPVETRYIERGAEGWRFATYVWNADASDAVLAPRRGIAALPVAAAPRGRYAIPSQDDCLACHGGTTVPVLGVSALQLSPDRDPLAPNGVPPGPSDLDLKALVERGWVRGLPPALLATPPRIAATTALERASLGYLHANCGHCHNTSDLRVPVRLILDQSAAAPAASRADVLRSAVDAPSRYRPAEIAGLAQVITSGRAATSVLVLRMASREAPVQMPPLGSQIPDPQGLALLRRWIDEELPTPLEHTP